MQATLSTLLCQMPVYSQSTLMHSKPAGGDHTQKKEVERKTFSKLPYSPAHPLEKHEMFGWSSVSPLSCSWKQSITAPDQSEEKNIFECG